MGVNALDKENLDSENEYIPPKASEMTKLGHPAKPKRQNDST